MYAGNLGHSQSLDLLIEAANRHQDRDDVVYVINGGGVAAKELEQKVKDLPNFVFTGFQPIDRLPEVLASADIHVVLLKQGLGTSSLPSKIYSIFAAGRPAIASVDPETELSRVLSETKAGIAVKPEEVEEFIAAIERLIDNSAERAEMGTMGRLWIEKQPTAKIVAEIYKDLLERLNK